MSRQVGWAKRASGNLAGRRAYVQPKWQLNRQVAERAVLQASKQAGRQGCRQAPMQVAIRAGPLTDPPAAGPSVGRPDGQPASQPRNCERVDARNVLLGIVFDACLAPDVRCDLPMSFPQVGGGCFVRDCRRQLCRASGCPLCRRDVFGGKLDSRGAIHVVRQGASAQ
jgi:hypothetical protein